MPTPVANPAAIAAVQDILKETFPDDNLESQLLETTIVADLIEDVTEYTDSDGLKASVPLYTGRTGGMSARGVGKKLAPADHQRVGKASYNYKNLYLQVQVEGPVVARMETARQACIREIDLEVNKGLDSWTFDYQRQLHRDGSARLTLAALPGNASSVTVALGAANYEALVRGWIYEGQALDIGTLANPVLDTTGVRVQAINDSNPAAPTVTIDTAVAVTAASHLFLYGNRDVTEGSYEVSGLEGIVDDTAVLGGLNPATAGQGYWKSTVEHNSGSLRALTVPLMNTTQKKIRQRGGKTDTLLCSLGVEQKYYELLQPQVRFAGDTNLAAGNMQGPAYNQLELRGDPHCLPNRIYFLLKKALQTYSAGKISWQNQTAGGDILAWRQDYDSFVSRAAKYCQVGTNRRNTLGVLKDIQE